MKLHQQNVKEMQMQKRRGEAYSIYIEKDTCSNIIIE